MRRNGADLPSGEPGRLSRPALTLRPFAQRVKTPAWTFVHAGEEFYRRVVFASAHMRSCWEGECANAQLSGTRMRTCAVVGTTSAQVRSCSDRECSHAHVVGVVLAQKGVEGSLEVTPEVISGLDADRQADQVVRHGVDFSSMPSAALDLGLHATQTGRMHP